MKKKAILLMMSAMFLMTSIVGCGMEMHTNVSKTGKTTSTTYYYYTKEEVDNGDADSISENDKYIGKKTVDGVEYSVYEAKDDVKNDEQIATEIKADGFYTTGTSNNGENENVSQAITAGVSPFVYTITFPNEIQYTNGKLSEDKKTVTYQMSDLMKLKEVYAYNDTFLQTKTPEIIGISDYSKYINTKNIKVQGFGTLSKVVVNDMDKGASETVNLKEGKNVVKLTNAAGTAKKTVKVDTVKPKLNVKNGKTYKKGVKVKASDSASGIEYIKVDSQTYVTNNFAKHPYVIKDKGTHTIRAYDKAGNMTKVKVKVK